jgi:branched-chain amino acid transport system permease protein
MVGAYVVWFLYGLKGWPFELAVPAAIVVVGALGMVMERLLFRPMRTNPLGGLIMSVGVLFILQVVALDLGGGMGRAKHVTPAYRGVVTLFGTEGVTIPVQRLIVIVVAVALLGALWLLLHRTRTAPSGLAPRTPTRRRSRASAATSSPCSPWRSAPASPAGPAG